MDTRSNINGLEELRKTLRARKSSLFFFYLSTNYTSLTAWMKYFCVETQREHFKISRKISHPYTYTHCVVYKRSRIDELYTFFFLILKINLECIIWKDQW